MSGFIAVINTDGAPVDRGLLEKLTESLYFKGPDGFQVWTDGAVGFGHTLFRTTDEAEYESQPASLDGEVWITGSIRIDARVDLVNKLGKTRVIDLNRTPDALLVLHAYRRWGQKCLNHLLGDFAFALWDKSKKRLLCARDRFGMRQLYYAQAGNCLVVSNSLHCMQQHPAISSQLDDRAIGGFLLFGDHTWLDKSITVFTDIKVLLPASKLTLCRNKVATTQYWDIPTDSPLLRYRNKSDYIEHFQEVFKRAVTDRLRTNRVVISMSGGLDSSAIATTVREIQDEGTRAFDLNAVTIVYDKVHSCEERYFADLVASRLGISIQYIVGDQYPFLSPSIPTTRPLEIDQPFLWLDMMYITSTLGRIVLTGAAGDNLFKYPASFMALRQLNPYEVLCDTVRLRKQYGKFPGIGTGLLNKLKGGWAGKPIAAYPYPGWTNHEFESRMCLKEWWEEAWASWQQPTMLKHRTSLFNQSVARPDWCVDDIVMTNNFTLPEQRDPYLDLRMVELVLSLPTLPWLFNKHILRRAMEEKLPAEIIDRPKTPLGMLQHSLLKLGNSHWVDEWKPLPELENYIQREKIPKLSGGVCEPISSYVNVRPLILNGWLQFVVE